MPITTHSPSGIGGELGSAAVKTACVSSSTEGYGLLRPPDVDFEGIIGTRIAKLVHRIVRSELFGRRSATADDVDDVCSDTMVALLSRLQESKTTPSTGCIHDLDAYAAVLARRACSAWSRRRYPAFHNLRMQLRYLLKRDARFALWQNAGGDWLCGHARDDKEFRTEEEPLAAPEPGEFDDLSRSAKPAQSLSEIFNRAEGLLYFNDLARICARVWGVEDMPETMDLPESTSKAEEEIESTLDRRARLRRVWHELGQLPQRHCAALLLNLRDGDGGCATSELIFSGTATLDALADVLGIAPESFAELWPRLPLSDREIAQRMQITPQQVINLRKCARETLRKRMGAKN